MFPSQRVGLGCGTGELTNQQTGKRARVSTDTEGTSAGSGAVCCWRPGARSGAQLCWCAEGWWAGFPTSWVKISFHLIYGCVGLPQWLRWESVCLQCGLIPGLGRSPGEGNATHSSTLA